MPRKMTSIPAVDAYVPDADWLTYLRAVNDQSLRSLGIEPLDPGNYSVAEAAQQRAANRRGANEPS